MTADIEEIDAIIASSSISRARRRAEGGARARRGAGELTEHYARIGQGRALHPPPGEAVPLRAMAVRRAVANLVDQRAALRGRAGGDRASSPKPRGGNRGARPRPAFRRREVERLKRPFTRLDDSRAATAARASASPSSSAPRRRTAVARARPALAARPHRAPRPAARLTEFGSRVVII